MCAAASTVLRAVAADFLFNCWCLVIPSDNCIRNVPRCVPYHEQGFRLETFNNFYVESGARTPEFYSVSPYWFEYCLIRITEEEEGVVWIGFVWFMAGISGRLL
jgi:hypothetical protein